MEILQEKSKFEHITGESLINQQSINTTVIKDKKQTVEQ